MLNDIRLHVDSNESKQSQKERQFAHDITVLYSKNVKAFNAHIPSIAHLVPQIPFERLSVFIDKNQSNIVDFQTGTTLYGLSVDDDIHAQAEAWAYNSALLDLSNKTSAPSLHFSQQHTSHLAHRQQYAAQLEKSCAQNPIDTLIIMGLGKAQHIKCLFNNATSSLSTDKIKHIVIYEPDWEVFRCSLSVFDWASLLESAQHKNIQMFLQIGTDINLIYDEVSELHQQLHAKRILFFKHTNLPVYLQIIRSVQQGQWGRSAVVVPHAEKSYHFHYLSTFACNNSQRYQGVKHKSSLFVNNMALFKEYFPDIHTSFIDYKPICWQTIQHSDCNDINLLNTHYGNLFAGSNPRQEGDAQAQHFISHPNADGLIFGYEGDKLSHYLHNTFIRQADMILRENEQSLGELPLEVKVLMMFGIGNGYMLGKFYEETCEHSIQNLIICEPNPDFFTPHCTLLIGRLFSTK